MQLLNTNPFIPNSAVVFSSSKTCTKWAADGTKTVTKLEMECTSCNGGCSLYDTTMTYYPNGQSQGVGGAATGFDCDYQLTC